MEGGERETIFFWKKSKDKEAGEASARESHSDRRKPGAERRVSPRLFHAISVRSKRLPGNRGIARDLSLSGIRIEFGGISAKIDAGPALAKGERFDITLDLDLISQNVTVPAEVVWVKEISGTSKYEVGLRFVDMAVEGKEVITKYVQVVKESLEKFL